MGRSNCTEVQVEFKFRVPPPTTIPTGSPFTDPVVVRFDPYVCVRYTPSADEDFAPYIRYKPWIPGPQESLRFEAELVPAEPSESQVKPSFPVAFILDRPDGSGNVVEARCINVYRNGLTRTPNRAKHLDLRPSVIDVPGIYRLKVEGYHANNQQSKRYYVNDGQSDVIQITRTNTSTKIAWILSDPIHVISSSEVPYEEPRFRGRIAVMHVVLLVPLALLLGWLLCNCRGPEYNPTKTYKLPPP
jgi:hypothetical protein